MARPGRHPPALRLEPPRRVIVPRRGRGCSGSRSRGSMPTTMLAGLRTSKWTTKRIWATPAGCSSARRKTSSPSYASTIAGAATGGASCASGPGWCATSVSLKPIPYKSGRVAFSKGLSVATPRGATSRVWRVTSTRPCSCAVAARSPFTRVWVRHEISIWGLCESRLQGMWDYGTCVNPRSWWCRRGRPFRDTWPHLAGMG